MYATNAEPEIIECILALIAHLNTLLPGIRLQERLLSLGSPTYQRIADYLAQHGSLIS